MDELNSNDPVEKMLDDIRSLLSRSVAIQEGIIDLEKQGGEATTGLLQHATTDTALAQQRTGLSQERTSLVRAQTRLSTRSTELAELSTDLSRERSNLASARTDLSVLRTDFARARTGLAQQRVHMAESRTNLAEKRTSMAITTTVYSKLRSELARGRTQLALIRTGLAFLTLAVFLFREFGASWWTAFDGTMGVASVAATVIGLIGYRRTRRAIKHLDTTVVEREAGEPYLDILAR